MSVPDDVVTTGLSTTELSIEWFKIEAERKQREYEMRRHDYTEMYLKHMKQLQDEYQALLWNGE